MIKKNKSKKSLKPKLPGVREVKKDLSEIWSRLDKRELEDRHYIYFRPEDHIALAKTIAKLNIWSVISFNCRDVYTYIPKLFKPLDFHNYCTQFYFFDNGNTIECYRGSWTGSSYRLTHGLIGNALAYLYRTKKKVIPTYAITFDKKRKIHMKCYDNLRLYGHDLSGNYQISHEKLEKNIPSEIRIYSFEKS